MPLESDIVRSYVELVESAAPSVTDHEVLIGVQVDERRAGRELRRRGGGVEAACELAVGVYIGRDAYGGAFAYDPWLLYPDLLPGPNMLVLGGIGCRKSTLVKTYGYRQILHRRQLFVIDVKGEYWPLCRALGIPPFALRPGARCG